MNRPPPVVPEVYDPRNALDDLPGIHWALHEFLNSNTREAEEYCHRVDPNMERLYFAAGYGLIQTVKGLMSSEDKDLPAAINHTEHATFVASAHRKLQPLGDRLASYIVPGMGNSSIRWIAQMTPVERHAELLYVESSFSMCMLSVMSCGDWLTFIKQVWNMRVSLSICRQLGRYLEAADAAYTAARAHDNLPGLLEDPSIDKHFRSGVYLSVGLTQVILSLIPLWLLGIVQLLGYPCDRKEGLRILARAGGWNAYGEGGVTPQESEGFHRPLCDITQTIFHLALPPFILEGADLNIAWNILEWSMKAYPNSPLCPFAAGRHALARSQPQRALGYFTQAAQVQTQFKNMHHLSWWESAIANLALWNIDTSKYWWHHLRGEATWSKASYTYGEAVCLATVGDDATWLMEKVSKLRQRIAGQSIPLEKFVDCKARKYLAQNNQLILPALEFAYVLAAIAHAPRQVILDLMIPRVHQALKELGVSHMTGINENPSGVKNKMAKNHRDVRSEVNRKVGYWDDLCLARFLEGVCWRFIAYPDSDAELDPAERMSVSVEEARERAKSAFEQVFENGPGIELDHYIVYHAHFEYGCLLARSGDNGGAKAQLNIVLSGNPVEVNTARRGGKYCFQDALHSRARGAVRALQQNQPL